MVFEQNPPPFLGTAEENFKKITRVSLEFSFPFVVSQGITQSSFAIFVVVVVVVPFDDSVPFFAGNEIRWYPRI